MLVRLAKQSTGIVLELLVGFTLVLFHLCDNRLLAAEYDYYRQPALAITFNTNADHLKTKQPQLSPILGKGVLLVAAKTLLDPNFERTIVLITEFNDEGTAGLVLNRRTIIPAAQAIPQILQILPTLKHLYIGGPVIPSAIRLLVASETEIPKANNIVDKIYLIDTLELFNEVIAHITDTGFIRLYTGSASWAPGQLESELMRGHWYLWHADTDIIFNQHPEILWDELIQIVTARWVMN